MLPETGARLAAAGFLIAALDGALTFLGLEFTLERTVADFDPYHVDHAYLLEMAGMVLVAVGGFALLRRVWGETERVPGPILAGVFLLTAGAALRALFFVLTYLYAPYFAAEDGSLVGWFRTWNSAALAVAVGAALLAGFVSPVTTRSILGTAAAAGAFAFVFLLVAEPEVTLGLTLLRDVALVALAAGMLGAAMGLKKNAYALFT